LFERCYDLEAKSYIKITNEQVLTLDFFCHCFSFGAKSYKNHSDFAAIANSIIVFFSHWSSVLFVIILKSVIDFSVISQCRCFISPCEKFHCL